MSMYCFGGPQDILATQTSDQRSHFLAHGWTASFASRFPAPPFEIERFESALQRAAAAHGKHEKLIGHADPNWLDWYAAYMAAEQAGTELPK